MFEVYLLSANEKPEFAIFQVTEPTTGGNPESTGTKSVVGGGWGGVISGKYIQQAIIGSSFSRTRRTDFRIETIFRTHSPK